MGIGLLGFFSSHFGLVLTIGGYGGLRVLGKGTIGGARPLVFSAAFSFGIYWREN